MEASSSGSSNRVSLTTTCLGGILHYFLSICPLTPKLDVNIAAKWFSRCLYYLVFMTLG